MRPRARSAQRGPVGGREGGREERTHHPARDRPDRGPAAEGRAAEISVGKRDFCGPRGAALRAPSTARPLPPSTCRQGSGRRSAHPQARVSSGPSRAPPPPSPPLRRPQSQKPGRDPGVSTRRPLRSARPPEPPSIRTAPAGHTRMVTVGTPLSPRDERGREGRRLAPRKRGGGSFLRRWGWWFLSCGGRDIPSTENSRGAWRALYWRGRTGLCSFCLNI